MNDFVTSGTSSNLSFGEWRVSHRSVPYPQALSAMEKRVQEIESQNASDLFWLLEHPPIYTKGTSSQSEELIDTKRFPVYESGRGGRFTYHGPGQRIIYVMSDLRKRDRDIKKHVSRLEEWIINTLSEFGIKGEQKNGRIGIWIDENGHEKKIAAIGVRVRRWITYHGLSLNINPDLSHYAGIIPCGLNNYGVTSLWDLGKKVSSSEVDEVFKKHGKALFDV